MSTLTLTGIQTDLYWEDKSANLRQFEAKINAISEKTEVIVLPEMFSTGFSMQPEKMAETMDGETVWWMKRMAAAKKSDFNRQPDHPRRGQLFQSPHLDATQRRIRALRQAALVCFLVVKTPATAQATGA